jgi:lysophospholipase L1-like esterase
MKPVSRWLARVGLVIVGLALVLVPLELGLRWNSPSLPSLAALDGVDPREVGEFMRWTSLGDRPPDCRAAPGEHRLRYRTRSASYGANSGNDGSLRLWVVGDSLVAGWGLPPGTAWPHGLAQGLAVAEGRTVDLTLVGGAGLGHCDLLLDTNLLFDRGQPDAVVFQLFADDLEYRSMVQVRGRIAARPDAVGGAGGWLAQRSWLANRLWFSWVNGVGGASAARDLDAGGLERFLSALRALDTRAESAGATLMFVLVPPAGVARCGDDSAWSDCDWLLSDLRWMASALEQSGVTWLDLRDIWAHNDPATLADEEQGWTERRHLPVHPGVAGHNALAAAVLPALGAQRGARATGAATP